MRDVMTVAWKEAREHFLRRGRPSRAVIGSFVVVAAFGAVFPLIVANTFSQWLPVQAVVGLLAATGLFGMGFQGLVLPSAVIIDMFADERERHTLETLLAGPLEDSAILLGKVGTAAAAAFVMALLLGVVEQVTLLILFGAAGWGYLPALAAGPVLALAVACVVGGLGAIIGMRSATVKAGQQVLQFSLLPLFMLPGLFPILMSTGPGQAVLEFSAQWGLLAVAGLAAGVFGLLGAAFVGLAYAQFRRDRVLVRR
jgi:ABC-2 type transport system permease protein